MIVSRNSTDKWSKTSYRTISSLNLIRLKELSRTEAVPEARELVHKLAKVDNVKRVRAIAPRFPDIHWIDFELELQSQTELSDEVWDNIQDLVIDSEWKLRDDSGEKWYFYVQTVARLSLLQDKTKVIADSSCIRQPTEVRVRTWSSSPLKLVLH